MSKKAVRTVAFQIDDWDFLKEYDQRQQDSGLSVKNYFISLIKADIAQNQTQKDSPAQDSVIRGVRRGCSTSRSEPRIKARAVPQ